MVTYRDIILRRQDREDKKQDVRPEVRVVLTTEGGLQTSNDPFNDVCASTSERRVWYMAEGSVQPAQALCREISDPYVGLGCKLGYVGLSPEKEILRDDDFLAKTGDPTGWASTSPRDFEPGGRKQMWVYTKVITPLATYPGSGIKVNVISGDYPYLGARKSYAGSVNYDLSASVPGGGLCRYAGLYLDASNTLQTINGATIAAGSTPAEPSWPAGAFRLCVVLLTNGDTSIDFANILDRRMAWSDTHAGSAGWPFANILTVSTTDPDADYATIAAAFAAAGASKTIALDSETFALGAATISPSASVQTLRGLDGETSTLITSSINDAPLLDVTQIGMNVIDIRMTHSGAGTTSGILQTNSDSTLLRNLTLTKTSGAPTTAYGIRIIGGSSTGTTMRDCVVSVVAGTNKYALLVDTAASVVVVEGGEFNGTTADIRVNQAGSTVILKGPRLNGGGLSVAAGTVKGWYYDANGNIISVDGSGMSGGVWLYRADGLRVKCADYDAAYTAAGAGDTIFFFNGTYSFSASKTVGKSITIQGQSAEGVIITNSVASSPNFDVTADNVTFRNLTINNTGAGTTTGCIATDNAGLVLENVYLNKISGASSTPYCFWMYGTGSARLTLCRINTTVGTAPQYAIYNSGGGTVDLESSTVLNGVVDLTPTINWLPENKIIKNLLYSSMTHNIWQEGTTLNDLADDTYGPDTVWNVLNKDNAPDISGQAGGSTDPFTTSFRCTFDSNTAQAGIVQFLKAEDTYPLRGQVVSLSADLWGTNVTTLRMAVVVWTSTADTITSDIVGTWGTGNPTLATNWAYIGTPAAITITSTRTRYAVNNLAVPTNANNIGVFIWTDAAESSTDLWEVARVQLERGPAATEFVARPFITELGLVRHFFLAIGGADAFEELGLSGQCVTTTTGQIPIIFPVAMHVGPTLTISTASDWAVTNASGAATALTAMSIASATTKTARIAITVAAGLVAGNATHCLANNTTNARAYFNARL